MRKFSCLLGLLLLVACTSVRADIVVLKDGTRHEGKITLQTGDLVKIEVAITDKIRETKTIGMDKVDQIIKTAPDDAAFAEIQKMLPTRSLMTAEQYRTLLRSGPNDFLDTYGDSKHREKVEAIKTTLEEELDAVERGNIKLENEWYTPQDRIDFEQLIDSKIVLFQMKNQLAGGRYYNYIAAMREYEKLESQYYGTPAYADALEIAQKVLPTLGRQIQALRRDVDVKNQEWEANKNALDLQSRQRVEAARSREEKQFEAAVNADKKAGIKWTRVNPRSAKNLDSYISFAGGEYNKIQLLDVKVLRSVAKELVLADELIKEGNFDKAKRQLSKAKEIAEGMAQNKQGGKSGSYAKGLETKLDNKIKEKAAMAKAKEDAKKSEQLAADLEKSQEDKSLDSTFDAISSSSLNEGTKVESEEDGKESEESEVKTEVVEEGKDESSAGMDDFDALAALSSKKKTEEKASTKKKPTKKPSSSEKKEDKPRAAAPSGGGFPTGIIIPIVTVLLIGGIVVMKVLGIGGSKKEEE